MAFPVIPVLIALVLYVLHDDESADDTPGQAPKHKKAAPVKRNKSVEITSSDIDDAAISVPDSAPPPPENSVPTETPPENPPES